MDKNKIYTQSDFGADIGKTIKEATRSFSAKEWYITAGLFLLLSVMALNISFVGSTETYTAVVDSRTGEELFAIGVGGSGVLIPEKYANSNVSGELSIVELTPDEPSIRHERRTVRTHSNIALLLGIVLLAAVGFCLGKAVGMTHKKKVAELMKKKSASAPSAEVDTPADRRESLRRLYEAGIIDKDEYNDRLRRIKG